MSTEPQRWMSGLAKEILSAVERLDGTRDLEARRYKDAFEEVHRLRADLAFERARFPVCKVCEDPIPSAELLATMERAAPIGLMLTADATDLWAAGFCSPKCRDDFDAAGHLAKADGHFEYVGAISDVMKQLRDAREKTR